MFLDNKFILGNELVQKMGIHIANISMLRKSFEHNDDLYSVLKLNNCNFINTKAMNLPNNIKKGIEEHEFTDMSDKLPITWVLGELNCTERNLINAGIVIDKVTVAGKKFYVFDRAFVDTIGKSIPYILNAEENERLVKGSFIKGSIQLSKNKFLVWY